MGTVFIPHPAEASAVPAAAVADGGGHIFPGKFAGILPPPPGWGRMPEPSCPAVHLHVSHTVAKPLAGPVAGAPRTEGGMAGGLPCSRSGTRGRVHPGAGAPCSRQRYLFRGNPF